VEGKLGTLIEVTAGFHPELTGRENIRLNGIVQGMDLKEVKNRFWQIIVFAELSEFVDTPVKWYSSGMYARLAFSLAIHTYPDILLIDEALAVGDAQFVEKCLGRMHKFADDGTTIVFVTHSIAMARKLCTRGVLMRNGGIFFDGDIQNPLMECQ
jgi:ABC-type polysaccharide/polyol phosphate transport system ATPase subunit